MWFRLLAKTVLDEMKPWILFQILNESIPSHSNEKVILDIRARP